MATGVDVIVAMGGSPSIRAAREATTAIPIVMATSADPVGDGFIESLAHPGGNITGNCIFGVELLLKRFQMLVQAVGKPSAVAYLAGNVGANKRYQQYEAALSQAADAMGIRMEFLNLTAIGDLEVAFAQMRSLKVDAMVLDNPASFLGMQLQIAQLALKHQLPVVADGRAFAEAGLLMSYGADYVHVMDRTADFIARIWRGTAPRDLPVELVSKFDLAVNLTTAAALRISLSSSFLTMATKIY